MVKERMKATIKRTNEKKGREREVGYCVRKDSFRMPIYLVHGIVGIEVANNDDINRILEASPN